MYYALALAVAQWLSVSTLARIASAFLVHANGLRFALLESKRQARYICPSAGECDRLGFPVDMDGISVLLGTAPHCGAREVRFALPLTASTCPAAVRPACTAKSAFHPASAALCAPTGAANRSRMAFLNRMPRPATLGPLHGVGEIPFTRNVLPYTSAL
jgi:hypothetical protein